MGCNSVLFTEALNDLERRNDHRRSLSLQQLSFESRMFDLAYHQRSATKSSLALYTVVSSQTIISDVNPDLEVRTSHATIQTCKDYLFLQQQFQKHVKSSKENKNTVQIHTLYKLQITANSQKITRVQTGIFITLYNQLNAFVAVTSSSLFLYS